MAAAEQRLAALPAEYVTEIWCPPADDGRRSLHLPMRPPEPIPEAGPEPETEIEI